MPSIVDFEQQSHHHGSILVLIRGIGTNKDKSLQRVFERIQKIENVKVDGEYTDCKNVIEVIGYDRDYRCCCFLSRFGRPSARHLDSICTRSPGGEQ